MPLDGSVPAKGATVCSLMEEFVFSFDCLESAGSLRDDRGWKTDNLKPSTTRLNLQYVTITAPDRIVHTGESAESIAGDLS